MRVCVQELWDVCFGVQVREGYGLYEGQVQEEEEESQSECRNNGYEVVVMVMNGGVWW